MSLTTKALLIPSLAVLTAIGYVGASQPSALDEEVSQTCHDNGTGRESSYGGFVGNKGYVYYSTNTGRVCLITRKLMP